jgi:hypothetical protein
VFHKKFLPVKLDRQIQFSKAIKANGVIREFNFLKIKTAAVPTYHVDVSDERGNRHYFSLVYENQGWIIPKTTLPAWVMAVQHEIAAAVNEYETMSQ